MSGRQQPSIVTLGIVAVVAALVAVAPVRGADAQPKPPNMVTADWGIDINLLETTIPPGSAFASGFSVGSRGHGGYAAIGFDLQVVALTDCYADASCYAGYATFGLSLQAGGLHSWQTTKHELAVSLAPKADLAAGVWYGSSILAPAIGPAFVLYVTPKATSHGPVEGFRFSVEPKARFWLDDYRVYTVAEFGFRWGIVLW